MVRVTCLLAVALLLISSGAAYSRSNASPTTLVWANHRIAAFAQDGGQIAWAGLNKDPSRHDRSKGCTWQVWIRLLGSKKQKALVKRGGPTCYSYFGFDRNYQNYLALAGKRALWTMSTSSEFGFTHVVLVTASYSGTRDVQLEELLSEGGHGGPGDQLGGISGDSSTLVYGVATVGGTPEGCDDADTICTGGVISGGSVKRVTGAGKTMISDAPTPAMIAASGNRVAIVVAEAATRDGEVGPGSPATVVIEDAASGAGIGSFSPEGTPLAVALAPSVVAVLESTDGGRQIEFRTPAGALLRTTTVPTKATGLSTTDEQAVFRVGLSIRTVHVAAGGSKTVAAATNTPIGLSIEGTRVAWAENVMIRGVIRGRIRAITVR